VLNQGSLIPRLPSTIVDLTRMPPGILREGPIPGADLLAALGYEASNLNTNMTM